MLEQLIGMEKQEAINFIHSKSMTVRIAEEEGVTNQLVGDYVSNRLNIVIKNGRVSSFTEG
jgi:hypothetical protein